MADISKIKLPNGTTYNIKDANARERIEILERGVSASNVTYDNATSGLTASNVQNAIDEIAQDFQDGCNTISQAVIAKGQTPASNSPADIAYAISQIGFNYPILEEVYGVYTDPIDYTYTVTTPGQYLVMAIPGDNGNGYGTGVTISSTDVVYEYSSGSGGRQTNVFIVNCEVGDTISLKLSNYADRRYRGTSACILRNTGAAITGMVEDWNILSIDRTASTSKTLTLNTLYLCIAMCCGEQHSSSNSISGTTGAYYSSNFKKSDININVINALSGTVIINQSQYGFIAGGATVSGYILTV